MSRRTFLAVIFGIAAPIGCLVADPFVFRYDLTNPTLGFSEAYLGFCQPFSYAAIGLSLVLMVVHLSGTARSPLARTVIAGGLLAASMFAFALGLALLPYSVIGLFMLIGIFGFTPFLTGWVYAAAFKQILRTTPMLPRRALLMAMGCLGFVVLSGGFQVAAQAFVSSAVQRVESSSPDERAAGIASLRAWSRIFGHQGLISAHRHSTSDLQRQAIEHAYQSITDRDFQDDLQSAND
jgi:hypothetical protein